MDSDATRQGWATRWTRLWETLGATPAAGLRDALLAAWREPQRAYHSDAHLAHCLAQLEGARELAERPGEVACALWFHDAVYDPRAHDNEARSAAWAVEALAAAGVAADVGERVSALIMATCHDATPDSPDARLVVDCDLAILGAPPAAFDAYEAQVRREYAWVPEAAFRSGRAAVLEGFEARATIFSTARFRARLEAPARANLARSLAALR